MPIVTVDGLEIKFPQGVTIVSGRAAGLRRNRGRSVARGGSMPCSILLAGLVFAVAPAAPAHAQLKPEVQTGSIIPVKPQSLEAKEAGIVRKRFARCIYQRSGRKVAEFLAHTDIVTVDLAGANIRDVAKEFEMDRCLGEEVRFDQSALGMRFSADVFRDLMAEEAYLASNPVAPQLPADAAPAKVDSLPANTNPARAQALTEFSDCAIRANLHAADALLRTMPESGTERQVAVELAPALGACLHAGQQVALKPANIRALIAYAMWSRFGRSEVQR